MDNRAGVPSIGDKFRLSSKYKGIEDNIWIELGNLYAEYGGVNLGQGFPDFQPAPEIVKVLQNVCDEKSDHSYHQYARAFGHTRLVKVLAEMYSFLTGRTIDPMNEMLVTGGAYGALFYTIMANVGPGDEVIVVEPFFDCYESMILLAGGTPVFIQLRTDDANCDSSSAFVLDPDQLRNAFTSRTKAIIINTPNNPLGKVFNRQELQQIANLCLEFNVMVISDEVYEWMIYDGEEHVRICTLPDMWARTVTIGSAGKTFSLTGWKLGWAYGPADLMFNLRVAHQNCTYMCQTPEQEAVAVALEHQLYLMRNGLAEQTFFRKLMKDLTIKRDEWAKSVSAAGLRPVIPQGGYFMLVDWTPMKFPQETARDDTTAGQEDPPKDLQVARWLAKTWNLHIVPPSAFCSKRSKDLLENFVRFNFYKKQETLESGRTKLLEIMACTN